MLSGGERQVFGDDSPDSMGEFQNGTAIVEYFAHLAHVGEPHAGTEHDGKDGLCVSGAGR